MAMLEKVTFYFEKDANYRVVPVNGVWGGVTGRGDVSVDFFYESYIVPEMVTQAVRDGSALGEEIERHPGADARRRIVWMGMMLTATQADSIGKWLQEKAGESRLMRRGKDEGESSSTH